MFNPWVVGSKPVFQPAATVEAHCSIVRTYKHILYVEMNEET